MLKNVKSGFSYFDYKDYGRGEVVAQKTSRGVKMAGGQGLPVYYETILYCVISCTDTKMFYSNTTSRFLI
jgi:hypothetical protein